MAVDKKITELESLTKTLENEKSFDKSIECFTKAAKLVKEIVTEVSDSKGKVLEIVKDVDGVVERVFKVDCDDEESEA